MPGTLPRPTGWRREGFVLAFNQPESGEEANLYTLIPDSHPLGSMEKLTQEVRFRVREADGEARLEKYPF